MRSYLIAALGILATRSQLCISTAQSRSFTCKTSSLHFVQRISLSGWLKHQTTAGTRGLHARERNRSSNMQKTRQYASPH